MRWIAVLVGVLGTASTANAQALLDRPLSQPIVVNGPLAAGDALGLAFEIGRFGRVPIGFEEVARLPPAADRTKSEPRTLAALTVGDALKELEAIAPQYDIQEADGVIVIRPRTARADAHDPLNQPVVGLALEDAAPEEALQYVHASLYGMTFTRPLQPQSRLGEPFLLRVESGSVMDVLNATLKASGQLMWFVRYRAPMPAADNSKLQFSVCLYSFDGPGACRAEPDLPLSLRRPGR